MTSQEIKEILIKFYKYERGADLVATEVEYMDFVAVLKNCIIEVEIKVSVEDFKNDFKKPKHFYYTKWHNSQDLLDRHVPNKFYFAVPSTIKDKVVEYLASRKDKEKFANYGVISFTEANIPYVVVNARNLGEKFSQGLAREASKRVMNEYLTKMDTFNSVSKDQKRHMKVYENMKSFVTNIKSCSRCPMKSFSSYCYLIRDLINSNETKKRCAYLFKEESNIVPIKEIVENPSNPD
jgi:hypothetical protein